jgi:hypothetical protein
METNTREQPTPRIKNIKEIERPTADEPTTTSLKLVPSIQIIYYKWFFCIFLKRKKISFFLIGILILTVCIICNSLKLQMNQFRKISQE